MSGFNAIMALTDLHAADVAQHFWIAEINALEKDTFASSSRPLAKDVSQMLRELKNMLLLSCVDYTSIKMIDFILRCECFDF